jgi:predicted Zn-dependent peptidase
VVSGLPAVHPQRQASKIMMEALGGGMYSMLFSRIRQQLGLCYSVGMYGHDISYPDYQLVCLYGGTSTKNKEQFIDESEAVIAKALQDGIHSELFECAKADLLATYLRATETAMGKMMFVDTPFITGIYTNLDEIIEQVRATTLDDCNSVAKLLLDTPHYWAMMLPEGT